MKYSNQTVILTLSIFLLFLGCESEIIEYPTPDPDYPTVYPELSENQIAEKINLLYQVKDSLDQVEIDSYGFVNIICDFDSSSIKDAADIENLIFNKINRYHSFLGFESMTLEKFKDIFRYKVYGIPSYFYFKPDDIDEYTNELLEFEIECYNQILCAMPQYRISDYYFESNEIEIRLIFENNKLFISGFWFPEIYIPEYDAISVSDAVNIVLNDFVDYYSGEIYSFNIEKMKKAGKVILKRKTDKGYSFFLCWLISISNHDVNYYIDSQTGEIRKIYNYRHYI